MGLLGQAARSVGTASEQDRNSCGGEVGEAGGLGEELFGQEVRA